MPPYGSLRKRGAPLAPCFETATLGAHVIGRVQYDVTPCVTRKSTAERRHDSHSWPVTYFLCRFMWFERQKAVIDYVTCQSTARRKAAGNDAGGSTSFQTALASRRKSQWLLRGAQEVPFALCRLVIVFTSVFCKTSSAYTPNSSATHLSVFSTIIFALSPLDVAVCQVQRLNNLRARTEQTYAAHFFARRTWAAPVR